MRHLPQAKLDKLGARKARHQFTHETAKADHFVNYKTTSWDHAPWKPAAAPGMTASALSQKLEGKVIDSHDARLPPTGMGTCRC